MAVSVHACIDVSSVPRALNRNSDQVRANTIHAWLELLACQSCRVKLHLHCCCRLFLIENLKQNAHVCCLCLGFHQLLYARNAKGEWHVGSEVRCIPWLGQRRPLQLGRPIHSWTNAQALLEHPQEVASKKPASFKGELLWPRSHLQTYLNDLLTDQCLWKGKCSLA